jgi:YegS/Rv2252/BmrU family lipid kinase
MKPSTILIANPAAKGASERRMRRAIELLRSAGCDAEAYYTEKRGDAEALAKNACLEKAGLILACGGDGTINEVINGAAYSGTNIGIIPMGTTNVLAKELGIPENVEGAVKQLSNGKAHTVSLGKIFFTHSSSLVTRYFSLMAGIGFDADAVYGFKESIKRHSGKTAYILSGFKTLINYEPEGLEFIVDGKAYSGYSAIIGKAAKYGGHFKATPDADLLKPDLYAYIMHGKKRSDILRYVFGILTGAHLKFKDITYVRAEHIEITGDARIQTDGDYIGTTPATVTVAKDALRLIW